MANTLGIPERTLAQVSASTNSINVVGGTDGRKSVYQPLVVRITDHDRDTGVANETDADKMALFYSRRHGEAWQCDQGLEHIVVKAAENPVTTATPSNVTVLFPNFDYSTFE